MPITNMASVLDAISAEFDNNHQVYIANSPEAMQSYEGILIDCANTLKQYIVSNMSSSMGGSSASVINDASGMEIGDPYIIGSTGSPTGMAIKLGMSGGAFRPSLDPSKYDGIDNIVLLFDTGYNAPGARFVRGLWHGEMTCGKTSRPALGFIDAAVDQFNSSYGPQYGVAAERE